MGRSNRLSISASSQVAASALMGSVAITPSGVTRKTEKWKLF